MQLARGLERDVLALADNDIRGFEILSAHDDGFDVILGQRPAVLLRAESVFAVSGDKGRILAVMVDRLTKVNETE